MALVNSGNDSIGMCARTIMIWHRITLSCCCLLLVALREASAADTKQPERLPPPRAVPLEKAPVIPPPTVGFLRTDRYAVWQNYAVDRQGHFRARVIQSPYGSYYHHN